MEFEGLILSVCDGVETASSYPTNPQVDEQMLNVQNKNSSYFVEPRLSLCHRHNGLAGCHAYAALHSRGLSGSFLALARVCKPHTTNPKPLTLSPKP